MHVCVLVNVWVFVCNVGCVCGCMFVGGDVYISVCACMYAWLLVCIYVYICMYRGVCMCILVYVCVWVYTYVSVCTCGC